jgi:hypothetical protein
MLRIFDAHVHLFDCKANTYAFFEHEDRSFKTIAGCWLLLKWFAGQHDAWLPS